jgi:hypothetical protein
MPRSLANKKARKLAFGMNTCRLEGKPPLSHQTARVAKRIVLFPANRSVTTSVPFRLIWRTPNRSMRGSFPPGGCRTAELQAPQLSAGMTLIP